MSDTPTEPPSLSDGDVYDRLSGILQAETDFRTASTELLQLGTEYLGVTDGYVTRIDPEAGFWQVIGSARPDEGILQVGRRFDLADTYCRKAFEESETVAVHHAGDQGWEADPAYRAHELETYLGTAYSVDGRQFGTVCFVSPQARSRPFSRSEVAFVDCLSEFVGRLLEQKRQAALVEDREQVIATLSRVLRHNLSNDLNVIHGHVEMVTTAADSDEDHLDTIQEKAGDLIHLANKARTLQAIVSAEATRSPTALDELVRSCADSVRESYPDATVRVDCPADLTVHALPHLETAVTELLENAAKHGGTDPLVEVTVTQSSSTFDVRVADNGGGIQSMEREVLESGEETPLVHGSGLGLWLVHWIVSRHGGQVDVTEATNGTTVHVAIPYGTATLPIELDGADTR